MSWTKRQFITQAYSELGYANDNYTITDTQITNSKYRLDSMMALWGGRGITLGYPLPTGQTSADIDADTEVPDYALEAVYSNLALRIAPSIGKQPSMDLKKMAREGYRTLLLRKGLPREQQFPSTLPRGEGNRPWIYDDPYFDEPEDSLTIVDGDGTLEFD